MKLATELYVEQAKRWPLEGRHILAHHDDRSIIVYQAYRPPSVASRLRYKVRIGDRLVDVIGECFVSLPIPVGLDANHW